MDCPHFHCYLETIEDDAVWIRCNLCEKVQMVIPLTIRPQRPLATHRLLTYAQELEHPFHDVEDYAEIVRQIACESSAASIKEGYQEGASN
jgi:hypothetical protein